jgi:hypothetical protein
MKNMLAALAVAVFCAGPLGAQTATDRMLPADNAVPRYQNIFVIVAENRDYDAIINAPIAPVFTRLAHAYGNATQFFGEVHPSEGNYVALVGGSTYGIHDDDAFYCKPGPSRPLCRNADTPGYTDHTVNAPHIGDQLAQAGFTWKGYYESIPTPGSLAIVGDVNGSKDAYYAAKHSGFLNFASAQNDPHRAEHITSFDVLERDRAAGTLPNFALIVPNQCNEMHGITSKTVPEDCPNSAALVRRGDAFIGKLVDALMASPQWKSTANVAIVLTFDEADGNTKGGCCGYDPKSAANFGGGRIPTVVITNHGPRGLNDPTPYNHYSLLRTIEDAFGLTTHLQLAGDVDGGVRPMTPLFAVR